MTVYLRGGSILVAAMAAQLPITALAQSGPSETVGKGLDDIIVTAQKREQNLQQTPISIAAFQAEALEERGITNIGQLASAVPNLAIRPFGSSPTTLRLFIRGVGANDSQITQDPPVGIYFNGIYIARPVGLSLDVADIERIEVLRGPQGTLYGRNTTGGAVNVITKKPDGTLAGSQLIGLGNYDALHSQTVLNLPLTDTLFVKGAFDWNKRDGWLENTGEGPNFSAYNRRSARFDARWLPLDKLTIDYAFDRSVSSYTPDYYHLTQVTPGFSAFMESQPHRLKRAALKAPLRKSHDRAWGHGLTIAVDTTLGEIKSITAYRKAHSSGYQDFSANPDIVIYNDVFEMNQKQFSQELQLVGRTASQSLEYALGGYYFREKANDATGNAPPRTDFARNSTYAIYGQATWRPEALADLSLTVGGRYTWDKRDATNYRGVHGKLSSENFSPSIIVNYEPRSNINLYAKMATGYKAGGFNVRQADFSTGFSPEKLTTYELGWKTEWFSRRLRWNTALFYSDYKDIQLDILVPDQPDPTLTMTKNAGKAKIAGVETDLDAAITETFRTKLSYSYLYNKITKVAGDDASLWTLPNAPKHSVTASMDWDIVELPFGTVNAVADFSWRSKTTTSSRFVEGANYPAYALVDLRLSIKGDNWFAPGTTSRISLWVRNVTNKEYFNDTFGSFQGIHAAKLSTYAPPRTFGVDLKTSF